MYRTHARSASSSPHRAGHLRQLAGVALWGTFRISQSVAAVRAELRQLDVPAAVLRGHVGAGVRHRRRDRRRVGGAQRTELDGPRRCRHGPRARPARRAAVIVRIDHVGIMVGDLDAALRFYTDTLGSAGPIETREQPPIAVLRPHRRRRARAPRSARPRATMQRLLPYKGPGIYHVGRASMTSTARPPSRRAGRAAGRYNPRRRRHARQFLHPTPLGHAIELVTSGQRPKTRRWRRRTLGGLQTLTFAISSPRLE